MYGQPESVILLARREATLPRPGRRDLCSAVRGVGVRQNMRPGWHRLVRGMRWVEIHAGCMNVTERLPPQSTMDDFSIQKSDYPLHDLPARSTAVHWL